MFVLARRCAPKGAFCAILPSAAPVLRAGPCVLRARPQACRAREAGSAGPPRTPHTTRMIPPLNTGCSLPSIGCSPPPCPARRPTARSHAYGRVPLPRAKLFPLILARRPQPPAVPAPAAFSQEIPACLHTLRRRRPEFAAASIIDAAPRHRPLPAAGTGREPSVSQGYFAGLYQLRSLGFGGRVPELDGEDDTPSVRGQVVDAQVLKHVEV